MAKQLILCIALLCSPAWATWTLTQVKATSTCSTVTTCAVTVTSTGAGHLLVAGVITPGATTDAITTLTSGACAVSWVHCANCSLAASGDGGVDMSYCLNSASGTTSITITVTSAPAANWIAVIWEASSSLGNIAKDSGATPSGTKSDTTCTSCAGVSLTLSGNNNFIAALGAAGATATGVTGTGWTNDLSNPSGDGIAHGITSGSQTAPATWTQASATFVANALAFQESAGGVACTPTMTLMGVGSCG
jgi:hypothetical protein